MSYWHFVFRCIVALLQSFGWFLTILPPILLYSICQVISKFLNLNSNVLVVISFGFIQILLLLHIIWEDVQDKESKREYEFLKKRRELENDFKKQLSKLESEFEKEKTILKREIEIAQKELTNKRKVFEIEKAQSIKDLKRREENVLQLLNSESPFRDVSIMIRDVEIAVFDASIEHLITKRNPAYIAAEEVREMKKVSSELLQKYKEMEYRYKFILAAFPEIERFISSDQDLISIKEKLSYDELKETYDRRRDYLSKEEYGNLTEGEKSQLALDRYIAGRKSRWQKGRDYEMSCAFQLEQEGYEVELHGIKYGLQDLGRDLIAAREIGGIFGKEILIIQCKNWNKDMIIHENVIMQLYGSTIAYAIEFKKELNVGIYPVLMIPSYSSISEMAKSFAKKLKVKIIIRENMDFPRIKCNINHGDKIYHLPFDQLYDKTEIKKDGEFYAKTVKEAEREGFRRAKKHIFK